MNWRSPLFTRILLWFLGLLVVSITGLILTTMWLVPPPAGMMGGMLKAELEEAIWAYEHEGADGLRRYTERRDRLLSGRHQLLDAQGRDLLTGTSQPELLAGPIGSPRPRFGWPGPSSRPPVMRAASEDGRFHYVISGKQRFPGADEGPRFLAYLWVVLLVVVLCYVLATTLARPIRELREAVLGFGGGDLRRRAQVQRNDELGELGHAFNEMADRIQTLLTAERRLLQDVSHELRTPLARLGFAVELARSSPDSRTALDRIKREADRVTALVSELIEMARAEGDPLERKHEAIELDQLLHGLLADVLPEAERKLCRLTAPPPSELRVQGDAGMIERALGNVVTNALRYAPEGTAVEFGIEQRAGSVAISVRDHGPGVPEHHLKAIFQPFFRVDESRDRSSGGVGLGLAIAQRTALLHHGELRAENAKPGLRVTLVLPLRAGVRQPLPDPVTLRS